MIWSLFLWKPWMNELDDRGGGYFHCVNCGLRAEHFPGCDLAPKSSVNANIKSVKCKVCKISIANDGYSIDMALNTCPDSYHVGQECGLKRSMALIQKFEEKRLPVLLQKKPENDEVIERIRAALERTVVTARNVGVNWVPVEPPKGIEESIEVDEVHHIRMDKNGNVHREQTKS